MLQEMTEMVWNCVYAAVACEPVLGPFAFTTVRVDPLLRSFVPITFSKSKKKLKKKKRTQTGPGPAFWLHNTWLFWGAGMICFVTSFFFSLCVCFGLGAHAITPNYITQ